MEQDYTKRVDEILNSLDGMQRAEASPYFYSKLRNRMQTSAMPRPLAWRLAMALVVVALLNVFTLKALHTNQPATDSSAQELASDYSLTLPSSY
jgi:hypothetical protein